jgi:hypothetical protein
VTSTPISEQRPALVLRSVGKWLLLITAALPVTTTGCLVGANYRPPLMKLPGHWNGVDEKPRQQVSQGGKTDLAQWWRSLNDPLLDQLIIQAFSSNLDGKVALARIREERAYLVMSRAFPQCRYVRLVHSPAVQRQHTLRRVSPTSSD